MSTTTDDRPDILMMPPLAALTALAFCLILHFVWKPWWIPGFPNTAMLFLGTGLVVAGFVVAHAATNAFHDADTNVDPSKPALAIVTQGPYLYTRNPMYSGLLMIHLGVGLAGSLDWTLVLTPALWAFLHFGVVLPEERYLDDKFGETYLRFKHSTRRWI